MRGVNRAAQEVDIRDVTWLSAFLPFANALDRRIEALLTQGMFLGSRRRRGVAPGINLRKRG